MSEIKFCFAMPSGFIDSVNFELAIRKRRPNCVNGIYPHTFFRVPDLADSYLVPLPWCLSVRGHYELRQPSRCRRRSATLMSRATLEQMKLAPAQPQP